MDDELIKFINVKKRFGKRAILDGIDLCIPEGKITGIIGASGEGKTTILKILVGFYKPTSGDVFYSKRKNIEDLKNIRKIFGFSTEDGSFYEKLTVLENLIHFGMLYKLKKKDIMRRAENLIALVGLEKAIHTMAEDLSMGMKKRLDVAISLIHNPKVLIMDEPTADLDPVLRNHMLRLIKRINEKGTTVILTTQLLGEMDRICDKIAILYEKKIITQGGPSKVKSDYSAKTLDEVFRKIFTNREKISEDKKKEMIKEGIYKRSILIDIPDPKDKSDSDELLKEVRDEKSD